MSDVRSHQSFALLVEQFALFQQHIAHRPLSSKNIEQTTQLAKAFIQLAKSEPVIFVSLLHTQPSGMPFVYRYIFNTCVLVTLLCLRHHWHETPTTQLLCAALTLHSHRLKSIQYWSQHTGANKQDGQVHTIPITLPKPITAKHPLWSECCDIPWLLLTQLNHISGISSCSFAQQIIIVASQLSLPITPGKRHPTVRFAHAMTQLTRGLTPESYQHIELILQITGLYPPGSSVKLFSAETAKVLSLLPQGLLIRIAGKDGSATARLELIQPSEIAASLACHRVDDLTLYLSQWWDKTWQEWQHAQSKPPHSRIQPVYFRLDIPPPTLTDVQQQLDLAEPDTNTLTRLISSERSLADYIQHQATLKSRQKLAMTNVKQALLMQGFERTYSILCQQALTIRLEQYRFPCAESLIQFSRLRSAVAGQLAQLSPLPILVEESECMTSFASAGLFTHPQLRSAAKLDANPSPGLDICCIFNIGQPELLLEHAIKLAQYWRLDSITIDAIRYCGRLAIEGKRRPALTRQLASLLGLSLILAQQLYFGQSRPMTNKTQEEYELAMTTLSLTGQDVQSALIRAVEQVKPLVPLVKMGD